MAIRDKKYIEWIKSQRCAICGWKSDKPNSPHHVGDGVHTKRYSDYWVVPLCDWYYDRDSNNCHHKEAHKHPGKWTHLLRDLSQLLREFYERGNGDEML